MLPYDENREQPPLFELMGFFEQKPTELKPEVVAANIPEPRVHPVDALRGLARRLAEQKGLEVDEKSFDDAKAQLDKQAVSAVAAQVGKSAMAMADFNHQLNKSLEAPGKAARDKALAKVEKNADSGWKEAALAAVKRTAYEAQSFIVDAVWLRLPEGASTHEGRAMGSIMKKAQANGWIKPTDQFQPSIVKEHHACPRRVWVSLIYGGAH